VLRGRLVEQVLDARGNLVTVTTDVPLNLHLRAAEVLAEHHLGFGLPLPEPEAPPRAV